MSLKNIVAPIILKLNNFSPETTLGASIQSKSTESIGQDNDLANVRKTTISAALHQLRLYGEVGSHKKQDFVIPKIEL